MHKIQGIPDMEIEMNSNSYLNTAITAHLIDARVEEARSRRVVAAARRRSRRSRVEVDEIPAGPSRRSSFSRPVTA